MEEEEEEEEEEDEAEGEEEEEEEEEEDAACYAREEEEFHLQPSKYKLRRCARVVSILVKQGCHGRLIRTLLGKSEFARLQNECSSVSRSHVKSSSGQDDVIQKSLLSV